MNRKDVQMRRILEQQEREYIARQEQEKALQETAAANNIEKMRYEAAMRDRKRRLHLENRTMFCDKARTYVLETVLTSIFDKCFSNPDEDTCAFNAKLISDFVEEEGSSALLSHMETASDLMSALALECSEAAMEINSKVDKNDKDTEMIDPTDTEQLTKDVNGSEEIEDMTDAIRMRVSRATEDFVQKNMMDKINIKDIMLTTKEKMDDVKSGDDATDEQIKSEQAALTKRKITAVYRRPHSIYEQLMFNLSEACLSNEELKKAYVSESGKINMSAINKKAQSIYTFLEFVNSFKLKELTTEYITECITIK